MARKQPKGTQAPVEDCGGDAVKAKAQQDGVSVQGMQEEADGQEKKPFNLPICNITGEFEVIWRGHNDYPPIGIFVATRKLLDAGTFTSDGKVTDKEGNIRDHMTLETKEQWELVRAGIDAHRADRPVPYDEFVDEVEKLVRLLDTVQKRNAWRRVDFTAVRSEVKDVQDTFRNASGKVSAGEQVDCKDGVKAAFEARNSILEFEISLIESQLMSVGKATGQEEMAELMQGQVEEISHGDLERKRQNLTGAVSQLKDASRKSEQQSRESVALGDLPPVPVVPVPDRRPGNSYRPGLRRGERRGRFGEAQARY